MIKQYINEQRLQFLNSAFPLVPPNKPEISFGQLLDGGGSQEVRCEVEGGYPDEGEIWWQIDGKDVVKLTPTFNTNHGTCRADMTSIYNFEPDRADNGVTITCEVHHPSSKTTFPATSTNLDVQCMYNNPCTPSL